MPKAIKGALIECCFKGSLQVPDIRFTPPCPYASDPSIRALILNIDSKHNDIIIEELDDTHLLVDISQVDYIKEELNRLLNANTFMPTELEN